jgi:hypothetical protein
VEAVDERVVALNHAAVGVVDEILWLPSPGVAVTAVRLLYGPEAGLPEPLMDHVGRGAPPPFASLVGCARPLAHPLPSRLRFLVGWRERSNELKEVRSVARRRYRDLQTSFVASPAPAALDGLDALVQYTYGPRGRWLRGEAAARLLGRIAALNRAALSLLVAVAAGASRAPDGEFVVAGHRGRLAAPGRIPAGLAEALPPIAVPDFARLAESLVPPEPAREADESIERYRLLFGEMLGLAAPSEVPA